MRQAQRGASYATGWTKHGEAMCTDNPHPVPLSPHIARYNSQVIRETDFTQGHIALGNLRQIYFVTHYYDPLLTHSNNCSSPNKHRGFDITRPPHLVLLYIYSSLQKTPGGT